MVFFQCLNIIVPTDLTVFVLHQIDIKLNQDRRYRHDICLLLRNHLCLGVVKLLLVSMEKGNCIGAVIFDWHCLRLQKSYWEKSDMLG